MILAASVKEATVARATFHLSVFSFGVCSVVLGMEGEAPARSAPLYCLPSSFAVFKR